MCLTETLDEMVSNGILSPELAIQVLVQFDKVDFPSQFLLLINQGWRAWLCADIGTVFEYLVLFFVLLAVND